MVSRRTNTSLQPLLWLVAAMMIRNSRPPRRWRTDLPSHTRFCATKGNRSPVLENFGGTEIYPADNRSGAETRLIQKTPHSPQIRAPGRLAEGPPECYVPQAVADQAAKGHPVIRHTAKREGENTAIGSPRPQVCERTGSPRQQAGSPRASRGMPSTVSVRGSRQAAPRPLRLLAVILHKVVWVYVPNRPGFEIHRSARVGRRLRCYRQHGVVIGGPVMIGDDCVFSHGITIAASDKRVSCRPRRSVRCDT